MTTAAAGEEVKHLRVIPDVGGGHAAIQQLQGNELFGKLQGMAAVAHEVVIYKINKSASGEPPNLLNFINYLIHRAVSELAPIYLSDFAKVAIVGTAPG